MKVHEVISVQHTKSNSATGSEGLAQGSHLRSATRRPSSQPGRKKRDNLRGEPGHLYVRQNRSPQSLQRFGIRHCCITPSLYSPICFEIRLQDVLREDRQIHVHQPNGFLLRPGSKIGCRSCRKPQTLTETVEMCSIGIQNGTAWKRELVAMRCHGFCSTALSDPNLGAQT